VCTKFRSDRSINSWVKTTFGFWRQTASILDFYFQFQFWPLFFIVIVMSFRVDLPPFIQIGLSVSKIWRHRHFQDGGRPLCWIWCKEMIDHSRSVVVGRNLPFRFRVLWISSFGVIATFRFWHLGLKLRTHAHFGGFWDIFPPNGVTHHCSPLAPKHVV